MKVSSASTIPLNVSRLVHRWRSQKPMPPAEGRRRMHAAKPGRLRQAFPLDHRLGVVEPALPFTQMRHRRFGQRVERAPATLAAELRIPTQSGQGFRFDVGHRSDLITATILK